MPFVGQGLADGPGKLGQLFNICGIQLHGIVIHQKKPIAGPCDVADDAPVAWHLNRLHFCGRALTGDIDHGYFAGFMERGGNGAHGCFDAMIAVGDFAQVRQRSHQSNCAVHAHAEISNIVEENHAGGTGGIGRLAEDSADDDVGAAGFVGQCAAEIIVFAGESAPFARPRYRRRDPGHR